MPSFAELVIRSTGASRFITAAGHVISGRRSVYCGADCFISAGRSVYHGVGDLLWISRWRLAETCCKTLVIERLAQPDGKRPQSLVLTSLQENAMTPSLLPMSSPPVVA